MAFGGQLRSVSGGIAVDRLFVLFLYLRAGMLRCSRLSISLLPIFCYR